jgi:hypothetical protein
MDSTRARAIAMPTQYPNTGPAGMVAHAPVALRDRIAGA